MLAKDLDDVGLVKIGKVGLIRRVTLKHATYLKIYTCCGIEKRLAPVEGVRRFCSDVPYRPDPLGWREFRVGASRAWNDPSHIASAAPAARETLK